jgi:hypothetical protein
MGIVMMTPRVFIVDPQVRRLVLTCDHPRKRSIYHQEHPGHHHGVPCYDQPLML